MKILLLLLLLVAIPVSAISYERRQTVNGNIALDQFSLVTCDRDKRPGIVNAERACCINQNKNGYCENDEPKLGPCESNICMWATPTYKPVYLRYKTSPCTGLAVLAGKEYEPLLKSAKCEKNDKYWCCDPFSFPPLESGVKLKPETGRPGPNPNGALLVLNPSKWQIMKLGRLKVQKYEQRALEFEQKRCAEGGGPIKIIDVKYGSWFADKRNILPGWRAFFIKPNEVIPLVTWCD